MSPARPHGECGDDPRGQLRTSLNSLHPPVNCAASCELSIFQSRSAPLESRLPAAWHRLLVFKRDRRFRRECKIGFWYRARAIGTNVFIDEDCAATTL